MGADDVKRSEHLSEQVQAGARLVGNIVRFGHLPPGSGRRCTVLHSDGLVEIEGMVGHFAPHLFEIDGEVEVIPLEGTVS